MLASLNKSKPERVAMIYEHSQLEKIVLSSWKVQRNGSNSTRYTSETTHFLELNVRNYNKCHFLPKTSASLSMEAGASSTSYYTAAISWYIVELAKPALHYKTNKSYIGGN